MAVFLESCPPVRFIALRLAFQSRLGSLTRLTPSCRHAAAVATITEATDLDLSSGDIERLAQRLAAPAVAIDADKSWPGMYELASIIIGNHVKQEAMA